MQRRDMLKALATSSASALAFPNLVLGKDAGDAVAETAPGLVAVRNGEPAQMLDSALEALGGMQRFVPKGSTVIVKPNIGWAREIETGANTNPFLVKRAVELALNAGAKKVYVFDHSVGPCSICYDKSGISEAAKSAGAIVVPGDDEKHYQEVQIAGAVKLHTTDVHELLLEADVLINIPVLKHHSGAKATIAMKNLMGVVWDRRAYHKQGLQQCIADFCLHRKPQLNIVDAYRVTLANGPQRARPEDVKTKKMLLASADIVAVDAAAVRLIGSTPESAQHIQIADKMKIGSMNLDSLNIRRIAL